MFAVVSHPGRLDWLEATLQSLADQDYPDLKVVVLSHGRARKDQTEEEPELTSLINKVLPAATASRVTGRAARTYAAAVNSVCAAQAFDANYLLLLREGLVLEAGALRSLVEDAIESRAGVVGPKLLDNERHDLLVDVGGTVDRLGVMTPAAAPGELDQSQHDSARDVFVAPAGVMLIRTDSFFGVGGFDPVMGVSGAHIDLCWRVQMSARRVRMIPSAIGYQLSPDETDPDEAGSDETSPGEAGSDETSPGEAGSTVSDTAATRQRSQYGHRIRMVSKCYGWVHLVPALFLSAVVGLIEFIYALARGRFGHANDIAAAWLWNLRHTPSLLRLRRRTQRQRVLRDATLRQRHTVSTRRVEDWARSWLSSAGALSESARAPGGFLSSDNLSRLKTVLIVTPLTLLVLAFGSRHLLTRGVPSFGQFANFASLDMLLEAFWGGWREVGAGAAGVGATALGLLSAGSVVTFGASDFLRHLLIVGLLPLGLLGIWRLGGVVGASSVNSRLLAVVLYAFNPLPFTALATGAWDVLLLYATLPFIVRSIISLAETDGALKLPPDETQPDPGVPTNKKPSELRRRERLARIMRLGVLLGVVAAFEPLVLLLAPVVAIALAVVGLLSHRLKYAFAVMFWTLIAVAVAGLVNLVWMREFGSVADFVSAAFSDPAITDPYSLTDLFRFEIGVIGVAWLGWGLLLVTVTAALVATGRKTFWAFSGLALAATGFGIAWSAEQGWIDSALDILLEVTLAGSLTTSSSIGRLALVIAAAGCCLTVAAGTDGLKTAANASASKTPTTTKARDDINYRVQRIALLLVSVGVAAAVLPTLLATRSGNWSVAEFDLVAPLSLIDDRGAGPSYRVLWVGQPEVLPLTSRALDSSNEREASAARENTAEAGETAEREASDATPAPLPAYAGLHIATSVRGFPDVRSLWPGPTTPGEERLIDAVRIGLAGETLRMGRLLAAFGIRYVVVVDQSAPSYAQGWERPISAIAHNALESQIDLLPVATDTSVRVYRNDAWWSSRSQFIPPVAAGIGTSQLELIVSDLTRAVAVLTDNRSVTDQRGQIGAGQVLVTESFNSNWRLQTAAGAVAPRPALGWAMSFESAVDGAAQLRYDRPISVTRATTAQVLIWGSLLWLAMGQPTPFVDRLAGRRAGRRRAGKAAPDPVSDAAADSGQPEAEQPETEQPEAEQPDPDESENEA